MRFHASQCKRERVSERSKGAQDLVLLDGCTLRIRQLLGFPLLPLSLAAAKDILPSFGDRRLLAAQLEIVFRGFLLVPTRQAPGCGMVDMWTRGTWPSLPEAR